MNRIISEKGSTFLFREKITHLFCSISFNNAFKGAKVQSLFLNFYRSGCIWRSKLLFPIRQIISETMNLSNFPRLTHERMKKFSKELESVWKLFCSLIFFHPKRIYYIVNGNGLNK